MSGNALIATTLAALLLVVAGCDSGAGTTATHPAEETATTTTTSTTTVTTAPVTHDQFVRRLDRICRSANKKVARLNRRYADLFASGDDPKIADVFERAERMAAPSRAAMDELEVPPEDERGFQRYLALTDRMDGLFHREIVALRHSDDAEFSRLEGLIGQARNQRTRVAVDMGLRKCGS